MAQYSLQWRGTPDGRQTGWYIKDVYGREWGRITWNGQGIWDHNTIHVVHNDGSVFYDCGTSHAAVLCGCQCAC